MNNKHQHLSPYVPSDEDLAAYLPSAQELDSWSIPSFQQGFDDFEEFSVFLSGWRRDYLISEAHAACGKIESEDGRRAMSYALDYLLGAEYASLDEVKEVLLEDRLPGFIDMTPEATSALAGHLTAAYRMGGAYFC